MRDWAVMHLEGQYICRTIRASTWSQSPHDANITHHALNCYDRSHKYCVYAMNFQTFSVCNLALIFVFYLKCCPHYLRLKIHLFFGNSLSYFKENFLPHCENFHLRTKQLSSYQPVVVEKKMCEFKQLSFFI